MPKNIRKHKIITHKVHYNLKYAFVYAFAYKFHVHVRMHVSLGVLNQDIRLTDTHR